MRFLILGLLASCISACVNYSGYKSSSWPQYAYVGFSEKIDELAGNDALDCGFFDLKSRSGSALKRERLSFSRCVKESMKDSRAFKYGSVHIPTDSFLYEVLILTPDNEYWIIKFDLMIDFSNAIFWVKKCKSISLVNKYGYEGGGCRDVESSEWLEGDEGLEFLNPWLK